MKKNISKLTIYLLVFGFWFLKFTPDAFAAFRFPIKELGNCRNQFECKLFCDIPNNTPLCWSFNRYNPDNQILGITTVSDEETARKNNITFPIVELRNCKDVIGCREFCRNEKNKAICTDFAINKNLQKTRVKQLTSDILAKAKKELGCSSPTSCHNFCRKTENSLICQSFGEKNDLIKKAASRSASLSLEVLTKAKTDLGCSTELSCKLLCENPDNKRRCSAFAAKYLTATTSGQQKTEIPKERELYCQKNPKDCPGFLESVNSSSSGNQNIYLGPGGCKTEKECYLYCQAHPNKCPNFPKKTEKPIRISPTIAIDNEEFPE